MVSSRMPEPQPASGDQAAVSRLFLLELSNDRVVSLNPDGSDRKVIVTECRYPDGIAVDAAAGHIYWTNMGNPAANDGSIERADLDGQNRRTIVPEGGTFTPKQLQLEKTSRKLYWCDREGMRLMRANLDGSNIKTLVDTSQGDPRPGPDPAKWCVGVAIDVDDHQVYSTQKGPDNAGKGRLFRAGIEIPTDQTASDRADIELLYDGLPEPIDLELDLKNRVMYWTDRGDPPLGVIEREYSMGGRRLAIVGHSRGGYYARSLAARYPDRVSHIVTMGTGVEDPLDVSILTKCGAAVVRSALGGCDPARSERGCLTLRCTCAYAVGFAAPFPGEVRFTSIYSRNDGVVRWQSCVADYAVCVEVRGSHIGLAFNRHAYRAVAEALAVPATDE